MRFCFEAGEEELYRRLESFLDEGCTSIHERYQSQIKWHKSCYTSTTSKKNLSHLKSEQEITEVEGESSSASEIQTRRSSVIDFDWKKCIFCQKIYHGKDKNLINVSTFQFCQTLERTVNLKNDSYLKLHVGDFSKLMANEAVYHKGCHANYIKIKEKVPQSERDAAFAQFLEQVEPNLKRGRAYDMSTLLALYKNIMNNVSNDPESATTYSSQNLKKRLERHFGNNIVFFQQGAAPDLVSSRDINIKDVINSAFKYKESFEDLRAANDMMTSESSTLSFENAHVLFYASLIVRNLLKDTRGIQHQPLDPSDVTLEKAEELIKDEIYSFLYWILSSNSPMDNDLIDKSSIRESNNSLHRYIMSLGQDLVYMSSRGKTRTPKHIGLSVTCHKMTQSKEVIRLLNRNGQGVSYDEVQAIDTTWALQQINENHIVLPSNMNRGTFTEAADNWNRATDAVTGEHLDIVNLVLFQSKNRTLERGFDNQENYVRPSLSKDQK